jgi:DNA-binding protein HU-beta
VASRSERNFPKLKKNAENLGFLGSFPFTLRERSRMMRMSVHKESLVLRALYMGNQKKVKRRTMAKLTQSQFMKELAVATEVPNKSGMCVLPGIGRLVRVDRKARMGRNPATGEAIKIPAKKVVKFRVAKAVKDAIVPKKK